MRLKAKDKSFCLLSPAGDKCDAGNGSEQQTEFGLQMDQLMPDHVFSIYSKLRMIIMSMNRGPGRSKNK
jgi:hypothetical protein